jgi:TolB protein
MGPELERGDYVSYPRDIHAAWSPDGQWIVYRHEDYTKYDSTYPNGLYFIDPDGKNRTLFLEGEAALPAWSPNSQQIVFTTGTVLYIINVDGSGREYLTGGRFPRWSPDGQKIVFTRPGAQVGIWIIHLSDRREFRLGFGAMPDWSPGGEQIVFSGHPGTTRSGSQIWKMDSSGNTRVQLTTNSFITNWSPRWSPDGTQISWTADNEIWIMDSDGKNQRKLTKGLDSSWSPDSKRIIFSAFEPSGAKIVLWRIDVDGRNHKQLTQ